MKLTLNQALQKGIAAHKAGKAREADQLYTAVLKINPKHPDANHNMGVLAVDTGKVEDSLPFFKKALSINPNIAQFWLSYIDALIKLDLIAEAKEVFSKAKNNGAQGDGFNELQKRLDTSTSKNSKVQEPSQEELDALMTLYNQNMSQQVFNETQILTKHYTESLALWSLMGASAAQIGKLDKAVFAFEQAISIRPNSAEAHYNMGNALKAQQKLDKALEAYNKALAINPDNAEAYHNIGVILKLQGKYEAAIQMYEKALSYEPNSIKTQMSLSNVKGLAVPLWHMSMMNDHARNQAYSDALNLAIKKDSLVLEIGTGSGLLAMMAAKAGAKEVVTCEGSQTISRIAKMIVNENGLSAKVKIINKNSTDLVIGEDLPAKADIVVSEVLSAGFVGEGVQSTIIDANRRLLAPNGLMLPEFGEIKIALLGDSKEIKDNLFVDQVFEFNLSKFNAISGNKFSLNLKHQPKLLSNSKTVFKFDLRSLVKISEKEIILNIMAQQTGICLGIIQWIGIKIYKDIKYENKPGCVDSHWPTPIYRFDEPIQVTKGDELKIKAMLLEEAVWFQLIK